MKSAKSGLLLILAFGLVTILAVIGFLLFSPKNSNENALPTLIAFDTLRPSETENSSTEAVENTPSPIPATVIPTETAIPSESSTEALAATTTEAVAVQASATSTQAASSGSNAPNNPVASSSPGSSIIVLASATTNTAAPQIATATGQAPAPVASLDPSGLVAFNQAVNIGGGNLRVLSMTAPADEVMLSLGESIPGIQANQQWVLVELFLVCQGSSNCTPPASSFTLESSLNSYATSPLTIESSFGSLFLNGQSLGHIAFVIPRNETPFALELNKDGSEFRFALQ
jgi:hypothetical protein